MKLGTGSAYICGEYIGEVEMLTATIELEAENVTKFKVGDKVRILNVDAIMLGHKYWKTGDVTEVVSLLGDNPRLKRTLGKEYGATGGALSIDPSEFHAIEKLSGGDSMFNVGDKVRILRGESTANAAKIGGIAEITSKLDSSGQHAVRYERMSGSLCDGWLRPESMEPLTPQYRTVKRPARVGERILITKKAGFTMRDMTVGEAYEVVELGNKSSYVEVIDDMGDQASAFADGYEVIVEDSDNPRITALEAEVAELKSKVQTLEKADKPCVPNVTINASQPNGLDDLVSRISTEFRSRVERLTASKLSPNQQRKATVERAKAFVADVKKRAIGESLNVDGNYTFSRKTTKLTFHVNAEKRVVTALAHWKISGGLVDKAFAKCAPGDVFNADIGKAIAAGRLCGLDAEHTSEFEQAVQPDVVVVGMSVDNTFTHAKEFGWGVGVVTSIGGAGVQRGEGYFVEDGSWAFTKYAIILDDTEAQY